MLNDGIVFCENISRWTIKPCIGSDRFGCLGTFLFLSLAEATCFT